MGNATSNLIRMIDDAIGIGELLDQLATSRARRALPCDCFSGDGPARLIQNPDTNQVSCVEAECPLHQGATPASLCAAFHGWESAAAALYLAETHDFSLDDDTIADVRAEAVERYRVSLRKGEFQSARRTFRTVVMTLGNDPAAGADLLLARMEGPEQVAELQTEVAMLLLERGLRDEARRVLEEKALAADPAFPRAMLRLSEIQQQEHPESPLWAETLVRLATVFNARREHELAEQVLLRAVPGVGGTPTFHLAMGEALQGLGRVDAATYEYESAFERFVKAGESRQALVVLERLIHGDPASEELRRRALAIREEVQDQAGIARDLLEISRLALERGDEAGARASLEELIRRVPETVEAQESLADLALRHDDAPAAVKHLLAAIDLYIQREDFGEANRVAARLAAIVGKSEPDLEKSALRFLDLGLTEEAGAHLLELAGRRFHGGHADEAEAALLLLAEAEGTPVDVLDEAVRLLRVNHRDAACRLLTLRLARAAAEAGAVDVAIRSLDELDRLGFDTGVVEARIEILMNAGDGRRLGEMAARDLSRAEEHGEHDFAERLCRQVLDFFPDAIEVANCLAGLLLASDRAPEAAAQLVAMAANEAQPRERRLGWLNQAAGIDPTNSRLHLQRAALCIQEGDQTKAFHCYTAALGNALDGGDAVLAREALEGAATLHPQHTDVLEGRGRLALLEGDRAGAGEQFRALLERAIDSLGPKDIAARFARIESFLPGEPAIAEVYLGYLHEHGTPADCVLLHLLLAEHAAGEGDWEDVQAHAEAVLGAVPGHLRALRLRADALTFLGQPEEAASSLLVAAQAANHAGDHEQALAFCFDYGAQSTWAPQAIDEVCASIEALPDPDGGLEFLRRRLGDSDTAAGVFAKLSEALDARGRQEVAAAAARHAFECGSANVALARMVARERASTGDEEGALAVWQEIGHRARSLHDTSAERAALEALAEFQPQSLDFALELGRLLMREGEREQAVARLEEALHLATAAKDSRRGEIARELQAIAPTHGLACEALLADALEAGDYERAGELLLERTGALRGGGQLREAVGLLREGLQWPWEAVPLRAALVDLHGELFDYDALRDEASALASRLHSAGDDELAAESLARAVEILCARHEWARAGALLDDHEEMARTRPELLRARASVLEGAGEKAAAVSAWIEAARATAEAGAPSEAESLLRKAARLGPDSIEAHRALVELLEREKDDHLADLIPLYRHLAGLLAAEDAAAESADYLGRVLDILPDDRSALTAFLEAGAGDEERLASRARSLRELAAKAGDEAQEAVAIGVLMRLEPDHGEWLERYLVLKGETLGEDEQRELRLRLAAGLRDAGRQADAIRAYRSIPVAADLPREHLLAYAALLSEAGELDGEIEPLAALAGQWFEADRREDALALLEGLAEHAPGNASFHALAGRMLAAAGEEEQSASVYTRLLLLPEVLEGGNDAAAWLEEARAAHPENARVLAAWTEAVVAADASRAGEAYLALAEVQARSGDVAAAAESAGKVVERAAGNGELLFRLGELLATALDQPHDAGRAFLEASEHLAPHAPERAIEAIQKSASLLPEDLQVQRRNGEMLQKAGRTSEAAKALVGVARLLEEQGQASEALEPLEQAARLAPSADVYTRLAHLAAEHGNPSKAVRAWLRISEIAEKEQDVATYVDALRKALSIEPANHELLRRLAISLQARSRTDEAARAYVAGIEELLRSGDIEHAMDLKADAISVLGPQTVLLRESARAFEEEGIPELAARDRLTLARQFQREDRLAEALAEAEAAAILHPNDPKTDTVRLELLLQMGRKDEALELGLPVIRRQIDAGHAAALVVACRQLEHAFPEDPRVLRLYAEALGQEGTQATAAGVLRSLAAACLREGDEQGELEALARLHGLDTSLTHEETARFAALSIAHDDKETASARVLPLLERATRQQEEGLLRDLVLLLEDRLGDDPTVRRAALSLARGRGDETAILAEAVRCADVFLEKGAPGEGIEVLEDLAGTAAVGNSAAYQATLGRLYKAQKAKGQARKALLRAADLYRAEGNADKRLEILQELRIVDPMDLDSLTQLISELLEANRVDEAVEAMERLGESYEERGMDDLAEEEYRRLLKLRPNRYDIRERAFAAHIRHGHEEQLLGEYLEHADILLAAGEVARALEFYRRVSILDPTNLTARRAYIRHYTKVGEEADLVEEILAFAQMLVEIGEVDEAIQYFQRAMQIDPENSRARDLLSATQERNRKALPPGEARIGTGTAGDLDLTATQEQQLAASPEEFLRGSLEDESESDAAALAQIEQNYRDILAVNPQNADVRVKLADTLERMGRTSEMLRELANASETYFNRGELAACARICERYVEINPSDQRMRRRLNEAILKRDAFKALESAIMFSDTDEDDPPAAPRRKG